MKHKKGVSLKNFKITNSFMIHEYLKKSVRGEFIKDQVLEILSSEGFNHVFVDLSIENRNKYETSPCGKILMVGEEHIKNIIQIISNNLKVN